MGQDANGPTFNKAASPAEGPYANAGAGHRPPSSPSGDSGRPEGHVTPAAAALASIWAQIQVQKPRDILGAVGVDFKPLWRLAWRMTRTFARGVSNASQRSQVSGSMADSLKKKKKQQGQRGLLSGDAKAASLPPPGRTNLLRRSRRKG
ncbi:hypothetical protein EYF80_019821 [Liparis tanakae]|uniref:Uncharacterized protein n=1 Tax=Liparis tanakae TaxID=230148 RepID=A0A4Z2HW91_9TELE|nr:hypothetical protein EYF80_019821 [Liparis tanakae]